MAYVFDTNSFRVLGNYYPDQFPTFWQNFNRTIADGRLISVREVFRELESQIHHLHLSDWVKLQRDIFQLPSSAEMRFVSEIFSVPHFLTLVNEKKRLAGHLSADPFVIAKAKVINGCVVTEERRTPNATRIPNVCEHFEVDCINLQGFMEREGWTF